MGRTRMTARAALAAARLAAQRISTNDHATPAEVVAHLGAVQAQDYAASKWAIGARLPEGATTDADVGRKPISDAPAQHPHTIHAIG
mgnify:CR=1 FL=1